MPIAIILSKIRSNLTVDSLDVTTSIVIYGIEATKVVAWIIEKIRNWNWWGQLVFQIVITSSIYIAP